MMMSFSSPFAVNPMRIFAVRSLASLGQPRETRAALKQFRSALCTTLEAADVDMSNVSGPPRASFSETKHHALIVWYDVAADALRLFAPPLDRIDETTERALELLNGSVTTDLAETPIEDVDAVARLMALMSVGGDDARDLHARFIEPHLDRYDEDFVPPTVAELEELWEKFFPYYFGGTNAPPNALDVWVARAYAFGVGHVSRPVPAKRRSRSRVRV